MLFFHQKMSPLFFISRTSSFSGWASLACHPLSLFLCLSLALYSKIADVTQIQKNFPPSIFVFIDSWVAMRFPTKITLSCIWVAIPVDWVSLHWYACGTDRRSVGETYSHMITKISRMGRLLHFLRNGGLRTRGAWLQMKQQLYFKQQQAFSSH